jgi:hypothetical protein
MSTNEIYISCNAGRCLRPLIIVHYDENGNKSLKLTKEHIYNNAPFDELVKINAIEWIESNEQQNCLIAQSVDDFYRFINDKSI